jgi:two-component system chemotaxis response regulator CheY
MARVLIIDDNLLIRTLLREILTDGAHDVVGEASNGMEAPTLLRELRPDLVFLDLVMPGRDGLTTLNLLRAIDPVVAVIVCSASLDQRRVIGALRLGAKGFVTKPFNHKSVLNAVGGALRGADARTQLAAITQATLPADASAEQREFARANLSLSVSVRPEGESVWFETNSVDVSASGMLLATGSLRVGTRVALRFELGARSTVDARALVVRVTDGRPALQFEEMSSGDHERLNTHLGNLKPLTSQGDHAPVAA